MNTYHVYVASEPKPIEVIADEFIATLDGVLFYINRKPIGFVPASELLRILKAP
jgi:hypothetical protein